MKLWVDDVRPAPEGYVWCKSVNEAKTMIKHIEDAFYSTGRLGYQMASYSNLEGENYKKIIACCMLLEIELIDLDYDSGDYEKDGGPYIKLMDWLVERGTLYPLAFHSQNCVGMEYMKRMYRRYWLGESL